MLSLKGQKGLVRRGQDEGKKNGREGEGGNGKKKREGVDIIIFSVN